jgi:alkylhydroperoxidase family enzyme
MDIRHAVGVKEGLDEAMLGELPAWRTSTRFDARQRAALELTEAVVGSTGPVPEERFAPAREHFSDAELVELVFVIGYQMMASALARTFALPPQGFAS